MKKNFIFVFGVILFVLLMSGVFAGLFSGLTGKASGEVKGVATRTKATTNAQTGGDPLPMPIGTVRIYVGNPVVFSELKSNKVYSISVAEILEEEGVALVTVNGEGVSLTVSQKTDVGGLQIHLLKAGKSFFGRGYIDVLLKEIEEQPKYIDPCGDGICRGSSGFELKEDEQRVFEWLDNRFVDKKSYLVELVFLTVDEVRLRIDNENLPSLKPGTRYLTKDKLSIYVSDIFYKSRSNPSDNTTESRILFEYGENERTCPQDCIEKPRDPERPIISSEVTYEGVLKMLNSCQIIRTVDYRQNLIYGPSFNSCDKVCSLQNNTVIGKGHICISAARGQFDENNKLLPSYLEPINCRSETSMIQFQLYCTCCSAP